VSPKRKLYDDSASIREKVVVPRERAAKFSSIGKRRVRFTAVPKAIERGAEGLLTKPIDFALLRGIDAPVERSMNRPYRSFRYQFGREPFSDLGHLTRVEAALCHVLCCWRYILARKVVSSYLAQDLVAALVTRDVVTLCGILGDLVPQRPHRDAKQTRRRGSIPVSMSEGF